MPFYDILWQMPYDIKLHKVCQYGYQKNRLDLTKWSRLEALKLFARNKIWQKMQKTEVAIFPLYFQFNSFINFNPNVVALPEVLKTWGFFFWAHNNQLQLFNLCPGDFSIFCLFHSALLYKFPSYTQLHTEISLCFILG